MTNVSFCIHRAAHAIGGNCIEISTSNGHRLLLDAGLPLDLGQVESAILPASLDTETPVQGVLLSHFHADHSGLLERLPKSWPVYCGEASKELLFMMAALGKRPLLQMVSSWSAGISFQVGPFRVTPILTDHSAFDAYMLLIEIEGLRILYSGDFRRHGRKASLVKRLEQNPPRVDVLIMEGTNLPLEGYQPKSTMSEQEVEKEFVNLFRKAKGRVFVTWSSTNIDRTVSLYRACKQSGRVLVPDLFCMAVLCKLGEFANIPQPDWKGPMKAVVTSCMKPVMERIGYPDIVPMLIEKNAALSTRALAANPNQWVIMTRASLVKEYARRGLLPSAEDVWVWSQWAGYLRDEATLPMREYFSVCREPLLIHTSGHASPEDLRQIVAAINPQLLIPVHGEAWDTHAGSFPNLQRLADGSWFDLTHWKRKQKQEA